MEYICSVKACQATFVQIWEISQKPICILDIIKALPVKPSLSKFGKPPTHSAPNNKKPCVSLAQKYIILFYGISWNKKKVCSISKLFKVYIMICKRIQLVQRYMFLEAYLHVHNYSFCYSFTLTCHNFQPSHICNLEYEHFLQTNTTYLRD